MKYLLPLLLLCGCAAPVKRVVQMPPLPIAMADSDAFGGDAGIMESITPSQAFVTESGDELFPPHAPLEPKTIWLVWDNTNSIESQRHMLTEIYSTQSLNESFKHYAYVPPFTNSMLLVTDKPMEFFICRFVWTNAPNWIYSEWNQ